MPWHQSWHMGWMWLFWVIVIVSAVLLGASVLRSSHDPTNTQETPEEILKRRYSRGEIDKEEYEQKLIDIRK